MIELSLSPTVNGPPAAGAVPTAQRAGRQFATLLNGTAPAAPALLTPGSAAPIAIALPGSDLPAGTTNQALPRQSGSTTGKKLPLAIDAAMPATAPPYMVDASARTDDAAIIGDAPKGKGKKPDSDDKPTDEETKDGDATIVPDQNLAATPATAPVLSAPVARGGTIPDEIQVPAEAPVAAAQPKAGHAVGKFSASIAPTIAPNPPETEAEVPTAKARLKAGAAKVVPEERLASSIRTGATPTATQPRAATTPPSHAVSIPDGGQAQAGTRPDASGAKRNVTGTGHATPVSIATANPAHRGATAPVQATQLAAAPQAGQPSTPSASTPAPAGHALSAAPQQAGQEQAQPDPQAAPPMPATVRATASALTPVLANVAARFSEAGAASPQRRAPTRIAAAGGGMADGQMTAIIAGTTNFATDPASAVTASAQAQQGALDLASHDGMSAMIDRIATLRDGGDARENRIRLMPDALGTVDITVRRDNQGTHVHLAAESAAARTMLHDATPRLTELADQRGLKLASTVVDHGSAHSGSGQGGSAHQGQPNGQSGQNQSNHARANRAMTNHSPQAEVPIDERPGERIA